MNMLTPYLGTDWNVAVTFMLSVLLVFPCEMAFTRAQYVPADAFRVRVTSAVAPDARLTLSVEIVAIFNPVWLVSVRSNVSGVFPVFSTVSV